MSDDEPEASWITLASEVVYKAPPWIRVRRERIRTGSGVQIDDFYRIEASDFVLVYALDEDGRAILLRQWRQGPQRFAFSFPGGHVESGESPEEAGLRELQEETGYKADGLEFLGRFSMHSNFHIGWGHFYRALGAVVKVAERGSQDFERATVSLLDSAALDRALSDGCLITVHDALCARLGVRRR